VGRRARIPIFDGQMVAVRRARIGQSETGSAVRSENSTTRAAAARKNFHGRIFGSRRAGIFIMRGCRPQPRD